MINEKLNYNDIVKKQELTLEERYYIEGFDYGFDNIKIEYLKDLKNNIYFLKGFQDGRNDYQNTLKAICIK